MWFSGSISDAINKSKNEKKLFLVYIEGDDDSSKTVTECFVEMSETIATKPVVSIKLKSDSDSSKQFGQIYPILVVPSTYLIGLDGNLLEVIAGVSKSSDLVQKIDLILQKYQSQFVTCDAAASSGTTNQANSVKSEHNAESRSNVDSRELVEELEEVPGHIEAAHEPAAVSQAVDDRINRAQVLIEELRIKKQKEEEDNAKKAELERIQAGKEMQKAKRLREDEEIKERYRERQKDALEAKVARERVLAQIAADKAERNARAERKSTQLANEKPTSSVTTPPPPKRSYADDDCVRIQFRFPDGSRSNSEFEGSTNLADVRNYVANNSTYKRFALETSFPRYQFVADDYSRTLLELQLVPSSVLVVIPEANSKSSGPVAVTDSIRSLMTLLLAPFLMIWGFVRSFIMPPPAPRMSGPSQPSSSTGGNADQSRKQNPNKRDGNVARLRTLRDSKDDDENNTWNGNSTQQM